ncbi:MAG: hypothetical protein ACTSRA_08265 [Promethearchaeota archaeon]
MSIDVAGASPAAGFSFNYLIFRVKLALNPKSSNPNLKALCGIDAGKLYHYNIRKMKVQAFLD